MGAVHIDAVDVKGEPYTGYEGPEGKGPFECGNCRYFSDGLCGQKIMRAKSSLPHQGGKVKVDEHGCCEYVDRRGRGKLYSR